MLFRSWGTGLNFGGFGYLGLGEMNNLRVTTTSITNQSSYLQQTGDNRNFGIGPYVQLNSDIDLTSKSSLSGSFKLNNFLNGSSGLTANDVSATGTSYVHLFSNDYKTKTNGLSYDANIDYKKTFKKKEQEFTMSVQLSNNDRKTDYDVNRLGIADVSFYKESSLNRKDRKSTRLNSSHVSESRMPSSA